MQVQKLLWQKQQGSELEFTWCISNNCMHLHCTLATRYSFSKVWIVTYGPCSTPSGCGKRFPHLKYPQQRLLCYLRFFWDSHRRQKSILLSSVLSNRIIGEGMYYIYMKIVNFYGANDWVKVCLNRGRILGIISRDERKMKLPMVCLLIQCCVRISCL